jgi:hypothetical protein
VINTQLVETLAQIINALTLEEKALLKQKMDRPNWEEEYQKLVGVRERILARRGGNPLDMDVSDMIYQMREERTQQLLEACFPELSQKEAQIKE